MTRLPLPLLAAAFAASAGLHLAAIAQFAGEAPVRQEGGAPASVAALGASFADLAAGSVPATLPTETAAAPVPRSAPPPRPGPAPRPAARATGSGSAGRAAPAEAGPPVRAKAAEPSRPAAVRVAALAPAPAVAARTVPMQSKATPPASASQAAAHRPGAAPARPLSARDPARAVAPAPADAAPRDPRNRLVAASDLAPEASQRPPARPAVPTPSAKTQRHDMPAPSRATAPAGNADRTAKAGDDAGRRDAEATRAATRPTDSAAASGNAAASTYPGLVMRHVARVRRPDVSARGAARVTFRIGGSGALAGASVSRSSGSAALDRAALTVIRRAAPFPLPPAGAARTFTVEIRGR